MAVSCVKVSGARLIPTPIRRLLHHRLVAWISRQLTAEHPHHFLSHALAQIQISDKDLPIERPTKIELVIQSLLFWEQERIDTDYRHVVVQQRPAGVTGIDGGLCLDHGRLVLTGIVGCCARAASGKTTAAPPSMAMNPRRFTV
jgi:hypothetical protein